jgi:hypothetical protein
LPALGNSKNSKFARLETAAKYVHESPVKLIAKIKEADELWK